MNKTLSVSAIAAVLLLAGCGPKDEPATPPAPPAPSEAAAPAAAAEVEAPAADATDASATQDATGEVAPGTMPEGDPTMATAGSASATPTPVSAPASTPPASTAATTTKTTAPPPATSPAAPAAAPAALTTATSTAKPAAPVVVAAPSGSAVTFNGDPATIIRAETLRARPAADAPAIGPLVSGAKVKVLARDGGWYQVSSDGKSGWVRMLSVRRSEAATTDVAGLAGIASGRTGTGKVVTTTGVRGLDSGDLAAATFNEERIARAETLRVTKADADAFARQGGLVTQTVPALPAPAK